jgi:hypothetical protein
LQLTCLATNPICDTPDLDTLVTDEDESENDIEGDGYQTAYEVEEMMGSRFDKE